MIIKLFVDCNFWEDYYKAVVRNLSTLYMISPRSVRLVRPLLTRNQTSSDLNPPFAESLKYLAEIALARPALLGTECV